MGGSTKNYSFDKAYNARMATIAEEQQAMSQEFFDFWSDGDMGGTQSINPEYTAWEERNSNLTWWEKLAGKSSDGNDPAPDKYITSDVNPDGYSGKQWELDQLKSNRDMLPSMTNASIAESEYQTDYMNAAKGLIPQQTKVASSFYEQALGGVNIKDRMNQAQNDIGMALKDVDSTKRRQASRMGLNASDIDFKSSSLDMARGIGGARTNARTGAEQENFQRLSTAMGMGLKA